MGKHTGQTICTMPGCDRPFKGRGYCHTHLQRIRRHGHPFPIPKRERHVGRPFGKASEKYLQLMDIKSESEIARELGVSRQRIHQLETQFGVCQLSPGRR